MPNYRVRRFHLCARTPIKSTFRPISRAYNYGSLRNLIAIEHLIEDNRRLCWFAQSPAMRHEPHS